MGDDGVYAHARSEDFGPSRYDLQERIKKLEEQVESLQAQLTALQNVDGNHTRWSGGT